MKVHRVNRARFESLEDLKSRQSAWLAVVIFLGFIVLIIAVAAKARATTLFLLLSLIMFALLLERRMYRWHYVDLPYRVRAALELETVNGMEVFDPVNLYYKTREEALEAFKAVKAGEFPLDPGEALVFDNDGYKELVYPVIKLSERMHPHLAAKPDNKGG